MNSYELLRPDGTGAGIWSCGECHKPHLVVTLAGQPASDSNRRFAEECCAPRNCRYCGQITERDWSGQFRREHEECIPKYEPVPPHHSMTNPFSTRRCPTSAKTRGAPVGSRATNMRCGKSFMAIAMNTAGGTFDTRTWKNCAYFPNMPGAGSGQGRTKNTRRSS